MAALGLAANQIALAAVTYTGLRDQVTIDATGVRMEHAVSSSTTWPRKELGSQPPVVSGTILLANASIVAFIADVRSSASRKLSFIFAGVECYVYVYSGDVSTFTPLDRGGVAAGYQDVAFSFGAYQTKVFKSSDDSVLWGS